MHGGQAVAQARDECGNVLPAGERPEEVELELHARVGQLDEPLVRRDAAERRDELLRVVVVADRQAEPGRDVDEGVEAVGDVGDALFGEPALGRDEGVDDGLHAELHGRVEDHLGCGGGDRAVRRPQLVGEQGRVAGGRSETRGIQRGADLGGATDEVERLDVAVADRRELVERALRVGRERVAQSVELNGCLGQSHGCSFGTSS